MTINIALLVGLVLCACVTATAIALEALAFLTSPRIRRALGDKTSMTAACLHAVMLVFGACASVTSIAIGAVWAMDGTESDTSHMAGAALMAVGNVTLGMTIVRAMWAGVTGAGAREATEVESVVVVEPSLPSVMPGRVDYLSSRSGSVTSSGRPSPKLGTDGWRRSSLRSTSPVRPGGENNNARRLSSPTATSVVPSSSSRRLPPVPTGEFV